MLNNVQTTFQKLRVGHRESGTRESEGCPGGLNLGGLRGESPPETTTALQQVRKRERSLENALDKQAREGGSRRRRVGTARGDGGQVSRAPDARGTWPSRGPREGKGARWRQSPSGRRRHAPESPPGRAARSHHGSGGLRGLWRRGRASPGQRHPPGGIARSMGVEKGVARGPGIPRAGAGSPADGAGARARRRSGCPCPPHPVVARARRPLVRRSTRPRNPLGVGPEGDTVPARPPGAPHTHLSRSPPGLVSSGPRRQRHGRGTARDPAGSCLPWASTF